MAMIKVVWVGTMVPRRELAARQDITVGHAHPVLGEINWKLEEINFWVMDPEAIWEQSNDVQDWWMVNAY